MVYAYEAKDNTGRTVTGSLDARDEKTAVGHVQSMGYYLLRIAPIRARRMADGAIAYDDSGIGVVAHDPLAVAGPPISNPFQWMLVHLIYPVWSGVSLRDLALFYRQFAALAHAGVPLYQSLETLRAQTMSPPLRQAIGAMAAGVERGEPLSKAMAQFPWIFQDYHRAMLVAGEMNGQLDTMAKRLADSLEMEHLLRSNIKREMFMPVLTLFGVFLLPPLVMLVVQNNPRGYVDVAVLPLVNTWVCIGVVYVLTRLASQLKYFYDAILCHIPAIGGAVRMIMIARFARAMASLYRAGVTLPTTLRFAAAAGGNSFLGRRIIAIIPRLEMGQGLVEALVQSRAFPPMVVSMLTTGEHSGSIDLMMDKVAEYYEQESVVRLHQISVSVGVLATILMGIKVTMILIGFYGGYSNQLLNIGDS